MRNTQGAERVPEPKDKLGVNVSRIILAYKYEAIKNSNSHEQSLDNVFSEMTSL